MFFNCNIFYRCFDEGHIPQIVISTNRSTEFCNVTQYDVDNSEFTAMKSTCCNDRDYCNENIKLILPSG